MADFKDVYSPALVAALAAELRTAWADFPVERFLPAASEGLDRLELMQRKAKIAAALTHTLPDSFEVAADILHRALDSATFTGWMILPCASYVAAAGIEHPQIALPLLAALSPRLSSEEPIRAFIVRHPAITFEHLWRWVEDPDEHVRRLVSEGTRPRLPWAALLRQFIADPSPTVALLDRLYDDPSAYVRRSVANHLNDIAKDHPDIALACARRWRGTSAGADWVVRHGLRTLVKKGDPHALALLGFDHAHEICLERLSITPATVVVGEEIEIVCALSSATAARVAVDYVVHHNGARAMRGAKVFKLTTRDLVPGRESVIVKRHRFRNVSIRQIHPGRHRVEIQVNGRILGGADIDVVAPT